MSSYYQHCYDSYDWICKLMLVSGSNWYKLAYNNHLYGKKSDFTGWKGKKNIYNLRAKVAHFCYSGKAFVSSSIRIQEQKKKKKGEKCAKLKMLKKQFFLYSKIRIWP